MVRVLDNGLANHAVAADPMHGEPAWVVVSCQQITTAAIETGMNWPRGQRRWLAMRSQVARCRIDGERIGEMLGARNTRAAIAGNHVEVTSRRVRPGILDIGWQCDGAAFAQLCAVNVNVEHIQKRSDARVVHRFRITSWPLSRLPRHKDQIST